MSKDFKSGFAPAAHDVPESGNLGELNPYGYGTDPVITKSIDEAKKAKLDLAAALENRYKNPNWFRVAAGFAKPQLGGFFASLGSANEALGDWQEQQRAVAPTVAAMRAQVAAQESALAHRSRAAQIVENMRKEGRTEMTPSEAADYSAHVGQDVRAVSQDVATNATNRLISALSTEGDLAATLFAIKKEFGEDALNKAIENVQKLSGRLNTRGSTSKSPSASAPTETPATTEGQTSEKNDEKPVEGSFIPGFPRERFKNAFSPDVPLEEQRQRIKMLGDQAQEKVAENKESLGKMRESSVGVFKDAKIAHDIASDASLAPLFGVGRGQAVKDMIIGVLENVTPGDLVKRLATQYRITDQNQLSKLNSLAQSLQSLNAKLAVNFSNPTDLRTEIEQVVPSLDKTDQVSLLRALARVASDAMYQHDQLPEFNKFINSKGNYVLDWQSSKEIERLRRENMKRIESIMSSSYKPTTIDGIVRYESPRFFGEFGRDRSSTESGSQKERPRIREIGGKKYEKLPDGSIRIVKE